MKKLVMLLGIALSIGSVRQIANAQAFKPMRGGERVLWIADSYVGFFGPTYNVVNEIYKVADPSFIPIYNGDAGKGCGRMKEYVIWGDVQNGTGALDSIRKGNWKYVFVQPENDAVDIYDVADKFMGCGGPAGYPKNQDTLIKYFKIMDKEVKKVNSQLILWGSHYGAPNNVVETNRAKECYAKLQKQYPVSFFIPSYLSWDSVLTDYPPNKFACPGNGGDGFIKMLFSDCGHQNGNGMALDAFTLFTIYTGGLSGEGLNVKFPSPMETPSLRDYLARVGCNTGRKILLSMGFPNDFEAPSIPKGLSTFNITDKSFNVSWTASTDNVGTVGYQVYIDGVLYTTVTGATSVLVKSRGPGLNYKITLKAFDAAGHYSMFSQPLAVKTTGTPLVANGGFETPKVNGDKGSPTGSSWNFVGNDVGITNDLGVKLEGNQSAYNNKISNAEQNFNQDINLNAGKYTLTFFTTMPSWNAPNKPLRVVIGNDEYKVSIIGNDKWQTHTINFTVAKTGNLNFKFYIPLTEPKQVYLHIDDIKIEFAEDTPLGTFDTEVNNGEQQYQLYPNPSTNEVFLEGVNGSQQVKIYNTTGNLIHESQESKINVKDWNEGLYLVIISSNDKISRLKLEVIH